MVILFWFNAYSTLTDSTEISALVSNCLDKIIDKHINHENSVISLDMTTSDGFMQMVRTGWPGYGRNQDMYFYLNTIDGCNGLRALISYIMCFEGIYGKILTQEQLQDCRYSFENYPEIAYDEAIQGISDKAKLILEEIEDSCISYVALSLKKLGRDDYALNAFLEA